jgi:hypothetical protein
MSKISKELLDMLTEFVICELDSKALDGITYTMVLKSDKNKELYDKYMGIKNEAVRCGYNNNEVFRVYELMNGYIFDMDILTVKQITAEIIKAVDKVNGGKTPVRELLGDLPEQRRKKDMIALAKYLKSEWDSGNRQVEVALFSRNATNKIIIHGKGPNGEDLAIRYNAYAIRHWDVEYINEKALIPAGFRVSKIQPREILPSKTGASFMFTLQPMSEFGSF